MLFEDLRSANLRNEIYMYVFVGCDLGVLCILLKNVKVYLFWEGKVV